MLGLILAVAIFAQGRNASDVVVMQGTVGIFTRGAHAVGVLVDTNHDGYGDELFWFYSENAPTVRAYFQTAVIEFTGQELVITSAETGQTDVFSVGPPRRQSRRTDDIASSTTYIGYGLTHKMGAFLNLVPLVPPLPTASWSGTPHTEDCTDPDNCVLYPDGGDSGGSAGGSCISGGQGASSCSLSKNGDSCSVSCVTGYYACCSYPSCSPFSNCLSCSCIKQ